MTPAYVAGGVVLLVMLALIGERVLGRLTEQRAQLAREQRAREDREAQANRRRAEYERDIGYIARIFDPIGLFT